MIECETCKLKEQISELKKKLAKSDLEYTQMVNLKNQFWWSGERLLGENKELKAKIKKLQEEVKSVRFYFQEPTE